MPRTQKKWTAADRGAVVRAADACTQRGELSALLKSHGIENVQLATWRAALAREERGDDAVLEANAEVFASLERARERAGMSAWKLCEVAGIRVTTWTNWMSGTSFPKLDSLQRVAQALGMTIEVTDDRR